jgi:hypothetical protein
MRSEQTATETGQTHISALRFANGLADAHPLQTAIRIVVGFHTSSQNSSCEYRGGNCCIAVGQLYHACTVVIVDGSSVALLTALDWTVAKRPWQDMQCSESRADFQEYAITALTC